MERTVRAAGPPDRQPERDDLTATGVEHRLTGGTSASLWAAFMRCSKPYRPVATAGDTAFVERGYRLLCPRTRRWRQVPPAATRQNRT